MPYPQVVEDAEPLRRPGIRPHVDALHAALDQATAVVRRNSDEKQAFEDATELARVLRELADAGADLRAETAARIHKAGELSLAGLAERIGVSKSRADQLLKSAKSIEARSQGDREGERGDG